MNAAFRVVVLGGYGHFGKTIAERTVALAGVTVIIAGRSLARAQNCAARLGAESAALDLNDADFGVRLAALRPNLVISAAGPFQGQDYRVAHAAIAAGAHYIDIADSRSFVCGIAGLNAEAKRRNVLVVSGASSVPALSAAVIDRQAPYFEYVRSISHGITTSGHVPGKATVAALLSYCGKPILVWRDRLWRSNYGWQGLMRRRFQSPVGVRWLARCDVPDLDLFPGRYARVESVQFSAGVESPLLQWGIWLLAWVVRVGALRNAASLSGPLRKVAVAMEWFGTGRSAMFVEISGIASGGVARTRVWELYAENDHGPNVPCMAAVALARKLAEGAINITGAMPCVGLITLEEYLAELKGLAIRYIEYCRPPDRHTGKAD